MPIEFQAGGLPLALEVNHLIVAGWTGRDAGAIAHHIRELAAIGVPAPSATPLYYRVSAPLLTTAPRIQTVGGASSGEVEPLLIQAGRARYLGLASDHTDRALETHSVALSKQVCAKPCAPELWPWEEVADHLDAIVLRSWVEDAGAWVPYQSGSIAEIRPLEELIAGSEIGALARDGAAAMLCGTFAAQGGVRPAAKFRMEMHDPITDRRIRHEYQCLTLPEVA
ncbi:hypothetical protein U879_13945 [Defluviimonas sp. 20V17]|uniref:DUF2848 domain-containing protein n=1 Tax=Allgaiera indica TaxID=765699 RepID=A0AAN4UQ53_9RHOB|nr:DUF2848 domain-containing protein [Allgaiera indica]KDB03094.1 hypothetical protein U879_13945 [Defluviimonas sp. 20V17]GHE00811.1 hypothetical protein GCM10008024_13810 [Allgaiera indica]SDW71783.1 Protein of unknown function [Allgaiera indica]